MDAAINTRNPVIFISIYNLPPTLPPVRQRIRNPTIQGFDGSTANWVSSGYFGNRRNARRWRRSRATQGLAPSLARAILITVSVKEQNEARISIFTPVKSFASKLHPGYPGLTKGRSCMAEVTQNQCAHPKCTCPVEEGEQYCSQACSDAAEGTSRNDRCACPHPKCAGAMAA
jgi:hypothetical protein